MLPYAAIGVGYVLLFVVARPYRSAQLGSVMIAVVVLTAIVVARQIAAVWENSRLVAERTAREARFNSLVRHSSDVITVVDGSGITRYMSPAVQQVFGWKPTDALGKRLADLVHTEDVGIVLKIDKSFVSHVGGDEGRRSLARMIVALGNALSLRTIAEGVEHADQAAALSAMGCGLAQGFHYSRAVSAAEITLMIQRGRCASSRSVPRVA